MQTKGLKWWFGFATVFFAIVGGIIAAVVLTPKNTPVQANFVAQSYLKQVFPSFNTLTYQLHTFRIVVSNTNALWQYEWKAPTAPTFVVVWDSINNNCGPNNAAYNAMVTALGNVPLNNENSITLGTTPAFVLPSGFTSLFRLQLYPGDLRIETTSGSGAFQQYKFWSLFKNPGSAALQFWPNANSQGTAQIVWGVSNANSTFLLNFTANGQLIFRSPVQSGNTGLWAASKVPTPPTCVST